MKRKLLALILVVAIFLSFSNGVAFAMKADSDLPTYNAQDNFGDEVFSYYNRDITTGVNEELTFVEAETLYKRSATGSYIGPHLLSVGINPNIGSMLVFTAPYSGTITISNAAAGGIANRGYQWNKTDFAACYANIYGTDWSTLATYAIPAGPDPVATPDIVNIEVKAGQSIKFLAGSNGSMNCYLYWIPVITYTAVGETEHQHSWQEAWQSNETHHWHECNGSCDITENTEKNGYASHTDDNQDGKCDTCNDVLPAADLPTYNAQDNFGDEVFSYYNRNITTGISEELTFVEAENLYKRSATGSYIGPHLLSVGINPNIGSMLVFTAPYSGTITISNAAAGGIANRGYQWNKTDFAACYANIYGTDWSALATYAIPAGPDPVVTPDIVNITVEAGEQIRFLAGSNSSLNCYLYWIPVITYTAVGETEHQHSWQEAWQSNETHHWHECGSACFITVDSQKNSYGTHIDGNDDRKCDTCNYVLPAADLPTYNAQDNFGDEVFSYYNHNITTGINEELTFVEAETLYKRSATGSYIGPHLLSVGINPNIGSMLVFTAPYSGTITISNAAAGGIANRGYQWNKTDFAACYANIYGTDWSTLATYAIPAGPDPVATPDIVNIEVKAGQSIKFLAGSNGSMNCYLYWIPVISYTEISSDIPAEIQADPTCVTLTFHDENCMEYGVSWLSDERAKDPIIQVAQKQSGTPDFTNAMTFAADTSKNSHYVAPLVRHQGVIDGLAYNTTYYWRVGDAGLNCWSDVGEFTTREQVVDSFTFAHFTDTHDWVYAIESATNTVDDLAFAFHTGDFVDKVISSSDEWAAMLDYEDLFMNLVMLNGAGNHDTSERSGLYFNIDYVEDSIGRAYYSFDYGTAHFIMLDSGGTGRGMVESINAEQMAWLEADLAATNQQWIIIGMHKSIYSPGFHATEADTNEIREQLIPIMDEYDVDLVVSGHDHIYIRTPAMVNGQPNWNVDTITEIVDGELYSFDVNPDGTVYIMPGASGLKQYSNTGIPDPNSWADVTEAIRKPTYAAINIDGNSLVYKLYIVDEETHESTLYDAYGIVTEEYEVKYDMTTSGVLPSYRVATDTYDPVFGYYCKDTQTGALTQMTRTQFGRQQCGTHANYVDVTWMSVGATANHDSVVSFTAPYSGEICISNLTADGSITNKGRGWDKTTYTQCYAMIQDAEGNVIARYDIPASATPVATIPITLNVEMGDIIYLVAGSTDSVNCYIEWIPEISYISVSGTAHQHIWQEEWTANETHHWHECGSACFITVDSQKNSYGTHIDVNDDRKCDTCNYELPAADLPTYNAQDNFGDEVFSYYNRDITTGVNEELTFVEAETLYKRSATGSYIGPHLLSVGINPNIGSMLVFTAPYSGTITISNAAAGGIANRGYQWNKTDFAACYANIYGTDWSTLATYAIPAGPDPVVTPDIVNITVEAGEQIRFLAGSNSSLNCYLYWIPVITYTAVGETEHQHKWQKEWKSDEEYHWHDCTSACDITENADKDGYGKHKDAVLDGLCDVCAHSMALPGVKDNVFSFSDQFAGNQNGYWRYLTREAVTNTYNNMSWDGEKWVDSKGGMITKEWLHSSRDASAKHEIQVCLEFVAPYDGVISLSMLGGAIKAGPNSDNGVRIAIWKNTETVMKYTDIHAGESYEFAPTSITVKEDDRIRFLVTAINGNNAGDSVVMLPIVKYTSIKYRLGPDQGVYSAMDMFSNEQTDIWRYQMREAVSNTFKELTWDGEKWVDGKGGIIAEEWMHASSDASAKHEMQVCLTFIAPSDGVIQIGVEDDVLGVSQNSQNGIRFGIMQNGTMIYTYTDFAPGTKNKFAPITGNVTKGDKIYFLLCPISGDNAGDSTTCMPIVTYLSYEKAPEPELEELPDDPSRTYYNSTDDFGGFLNPWYYSYCAVGSQKLQPMTWNSQTKAFMAADFAGLQINDTGAHPYPRQNAVRVFRAPKPGTISISMNNDAISLATGSSGVEDGVYVSISLSDGASVSEVFEKTLILPGETFSFDPIEMKIYEGWELWFVVNCNTNNASDYVKFAPIIEYLEITDEEAPVYSNSTEDRNEPSLDALNPETTDVGNLNEEKNDLAVWLIIAAFVVTAGVVNVVMIIVFKRRKKK